MPDESVTHVAPLKEGDHFAEYRIVRLLGRGGMGEVYEAEHRSLRQHHALKLILETLSQRSGVKQRFEREARVMAALQHPNLVRVDDFRETDGRCWMRMGLVRGVSHDGARHISLAHLTRASNGKLDQELVAWILTQVLEGLVYAHAKEVVHRDLKPANILLEGDSLEGIRVRISDFGLVRVMGEDWVLSQAQRSMTFMPSLGDEKTRMLDGMEEGTSTRAFLGTYAYMSPEQKRGEPADPRSDLYALGLMAYRLLTGKKELGLKLPSMLDPDLVKPWDELLLRCVEEDPGERYASAADMRSAMEAVSRAIGDAGKRRLMEEAHQTKLKKEMENPGRREEESVGKAERKGREQAEPDAREKLEAEESQGKQFTNSLGMEFVWIEPGTFMMGSPENEEGRLDNEMQHEVTLAKGYSLMTTQVTQRQWKAVMGSNPSRFKKRGDDCPVECVSWEDVQAFIQKLNVKEGTNTYRLPTEAEWEYACRAGTETRFHWGDEADCSRANYGKGLSSECKGKPSRTMEVGSFPSNAWDFYDMHGNVREWCEDWYGDYPSGSVTDPEGPTSGRFRVIRGGGWCSSARVCRSAYRARYGPGYRRSFLGFRLARPP